MNQRAPLLLLLLLSTALSGLGEPAPERLKLFLLMGQSNMAGRGKIGPQDQTANPRIFMLTKEGQWVLAREPMHFDRPDSDGVGPGSEFARVVSKANPKAKIGLIPCAVGGSSIAKWQPGSENYRNAVERTRLAMKNGKLACILWHQGEADCEKEKIAAYGPQFSEMISHLRADLDAPDVPVIVGEIGHFHTGSAAFNRALIKVAVGVPRCDFVTTEDLTDRGDSVHFSTASQKLLGQRYAESYLKMEPPEGK